MPYAMISVENCANSPWSLGNYNTMTYEALAQAGRWAVQDYTERDGFWVGPGPRVTRGRFDPCVVRTTLSWLFEYRESQDPTILPNTWMQTITRPVVDRLNRSLVTANVVDGEWRPITVTAYDPTVHGSVEFWRSGQATNTRTRNGVDLGEEENRVGPNDAPGFRQRTTLPRLLEDTLGPTKYLLIGAGVLAVVGIGAYAYSRYSQASSLLGGGEPEPEPVTDRAPRAPSPRFAMGAARRAPMTRQVAPRRAPAEPGYSSGRLRGRKD